MVGIWSVDNQIKVNPDIRPGDKIIEEQIEAALLRDPYVERYEITVSVYDGRVNLYGHVDSTFEKAHADDVAARQKGVVKVNNFLTVNEPTVTAYDPYRHDWNLEDFGWSLRSPSLTGKTDWEIERDIKDELFWSPFVDSDEVNVEVEDGVAELSGTVDSWGERRAAEQNALEGGAAVVDNDLTVHYGPEYYRPEK
ncbi:MAG: BON domain-containing protein [Desulfobacterales bacterium]